ncbi:gluzincin family metallopeptidase [Litoribacter populi]|uniref:M1 family aminopeptidase n=1 Tax=Litoribacter populi TaxID=2598460 RepID=UPI00118096C7|nr:M1 family aminopeptidase [Litoribacter populi]
MKSYSFDQEAKPFATLTIDFEEALSEGKETSFSIAYSGKPSQGFWIEEYQWVDIDPDFMILPVFSTLEDFEYKIKASLDNANYKLIDVQKGSLSREIEVTSNTTSYYINPILASNNQKNGLGLYDYSVDGKEVRVFSEYADSARYVRDAALRIFDFFNSTFAREEPVTFCSVLYRPIPYHEHKVTRSFKPSVVFAKQHENTATLAHEISHFWWNRGDPLTTEKWLTESFAQYSEMMFIRHEQGEERFNMIIEKLAGRAEKLPPLLGGDRFGRYGDALIYEKGPYILSQLENRLGYEIFVDFMVAVNRDQVATTGHLLEVLEDQTSADIRKEFEELLKR